MAQLFSAILFSLAGMAAMTFTAAMLRQEWSRIMTVLSGRELRQARIAATPQLRVRPRSWDRPEPRRALPPLRAAA